MSVVVDARSRGPEESASQRDLTYGRDSPRGICGERSMVGVVGDAGPLLGRPVYHGGYAVE